MATKRDGLYKRGLVWWLRTDPFTRKPLSTRCTDLEAARRFRATRERLAADPAHAAAQTARLDEWIRRVIAAKERDGKAAGTMNVYRTKLGHWLRFAPGAMLADIGPDFVDRFVTQRRTEDVGDHTISKEVTHLLTVLKMAKRARAYSGDLETLRPPDLHAGYKPRKRALSREEVLRLVPELNPTLGGLVAVCVSLGCRLSEAFRLQPTDIDWQRGRVFIDGRKTEGSSRYVPILSIFRSLLELGAAALPLGGVPNNMRRDMLAACKRAGVAPCTTNDLRRTHATLLSEAGVDRDVTRRLLGHTTTKLVDLVYGQPSTEALGALAEAKLLTAAPVHGRDSDVTGDQAAEVCEAKTSENMEPISRLELETCGLRSRNIDTANEGKRGLTGFISVSGSERGAIDPGGATRTLHSLPALALAQAAERVVFVSSVRRRRGGKGVA